jgi:cell division cycle 20-like protein 1 (cofactor of APC complex)
VGLRFDLFVGWGDGLDKYLFSEFYLVHIVVSHLTIFPVLIHKNISSSSSSPSSSSIMPNHFSSQDDIVIPMETDTKPHNFTFDFVDNEPSNCGTPSSTSSRPLRSTYPVSSYWGPSTPSSGRSSRSPRHSPSPRLCSPKSDRVDNRYLSRLPPSYSPRNAKSQRGQHSRSKSNEELRKNLFSSNNSTGDVVMEDACNTPQRKADSRRLPPSPASSQSRAWTSNSVYYLDSRDGSVASATSGTSIQTFMNSPRRRGQITGISSPMSENLSRPTSVASSPSSASGVLVGPDEGAGDRFIPSRVSSNLAFSLPVGHGSSKRAPRRQQSNSVNTANRASVDNIETEDLNPAPSFGATMMGGGRPTEQTDESPDGQAVSPSFSDDAGSQSDGNSERQDASHRQPLLYDALLRSEMLGENFDPSMQTSMQQASPSNMTSNKIVTPFRERSNNLRFVSPRQMHQNALYRSGINDNRAISVVNSFNLSPVSLSNNHRSSLGSYADKRKRKIAKVPCKVLDAPSLQDDFYLNLVDWGSQNMLAVGLGNTVYLWYASTSQVTKLVDLSGTEDAVTSVAWSEGGRHLAVGTTKGEVQLWDATAEKLIRTMNGHSARVGTLGWKGTASGGSPLLASGSRDRLICLRDPRSDQSFETRLVAHKQEVCGLKWSFGERSMLASGGNDNKLLVWDIKKHSQPYHTFGEHQAAVKAIAWSPHQHGILASGGGTADRCIRFSNCLTGQGINCIDTGSQVCNLAWSKNCNEIVSTHGYSLNQIVVWKYPTMTKMATLTGHTYRVLYLSVSPDGSTIVTGAGDETLRFWQVFPGPQKEGSSDGGMLFPSMTGSVIR